VQAFDFDAGGLSAPSERWRGICEDGRPVELCDLDLTRLGIGHLSGPVDDMPDLTEEDIQALKGKLAVAQKRREEKEAQAADNRARRREEIAAEHSDLETIENTKKSPHALGAANIRRELKKAFPGVKFRVRAHTFAGGDSIDIGWDFGPLPRDVEKITDKYQEGSFDGMQDLYTYNRDNVWPGVFGGAKYVCASRSIPTPSERGRDWFGESIFGDVGRELCRFQGVEYKGEYTRHLYGERDPDTLRDHANKIIYNTAFPVGKWTFKGIESTDTLAGGRWRIMFEAEETEAKPAGAKSTPKSATRSATAGAGGVTVSEHTHTKKGFQMWIVSLAEMVDKSEFFELLDIAKSGGGWYSRAWKGAPKGFAFKEEERAADFAAIVRAW